MSDQTATGGRGPKVIIQIPCYNEAETLAAVLADLPTTIPGVAVVETLVIDDGSTDGTADLAQRLGVTHVVRNGVNRGLARTFLVGLDAATRAGADIVVNTDGDNQYRGDDIVALVKPVVEGRCDIAIGARPITEIETFSFAKRALQRVGSRAVRAVSGASVDDATSGFRAFTRDAALRLQVHGRYTYTLETIIQAGAEGLRVVSVPIRVNPPTRESRLVKSSFDYVRRSIPTIVRSYVMYRPFRFFGQLSLPPFVLGLVLAVRWVIIKQFTSSTASHIPSLIAASVCAFIAVMFWVLAFLADVLSASRRTMADVRFLVRCQDLEALQREQRDQRERSAPAS